MKVNYSTFGNTITNLPDKLTTHIAGLIANGITTGFNLQALYDINSTDKFKIAVSALNINAIQYSDVAFSASQSALGTSAAKYNESAPAPKDLQPGVIPVSAVNSAYADLSGHLVHVNVLETLPYLDGQYKYYVEDINSDDTVADIQSYLYKFYANDNTLATFDLTQTLSSSYVSDYITFLTVWLIVSYNTINSNIEYSFAIDSYEHLPFTIKANNIDRTVFSSIFTFNRRPHILSPIAVKNDAYPIYIDSNVKLLRIRDYITLNNKKYVNISILNPIFDSIILNKVYEMLMYKLQYKATVINSKLNKSEIKQYLPIGMIMIPPSYGTENAYKFATNIPTNYINLAMHGISDGVSETYNPWQDSLALFLSPTTDTITYYNEYRYLPVESNSLIISVLHDLSIEWFRTASYIDNATYVASINI